MVSDIEFSLVSNGVEIYHLPSGNFKQRVVGIFGKNYAEKIVPIDTLTSILLEPSKGSKRTT